MKVIYQLDPGGRAIELRAEPYEVEVVLQRLIADHPAVLTGELHDDDQGWVLVGDELGIPDSDGGADRFAVDLVFVDSRSVPTFVEVKRASNRELRRRVVAQLLDYAANAVVYWPASRLREELEKTHDDDAVGVLERHFGSADRPFDEDLYWEQVDTNLRAGRVRMVIVADEIPERLRRIIGFLNSQLNRAQVLGIEVKQYRGKGGTALVPTVHGQSLEADQAKGVTPSFVERLESAPASVRRTHQLMDAWATNRGLQTRTTRNQFQVRTVDGPGSVILLVREEAVEFHLGPIRDAGLDDAADAFSEDLEALVQSHISTRSPRVPCDWIATNFEQFNDRVTRPYWALRGKAQQLADAGGDDAQAAPS